MAKAVDPQQKVLEILAKTLADLSPKPLRGTTPKSSFFNSNEKYTPAAEKLALDLGWIEPTGEFIGKSGKQKELYQITLAGIRAAMEQSEPAQLLHAMQISNSQLEMCLAQIIHHIATTHKQLLQYIDSGHEQVTQRIESVVKQLAQNRDVINELSSKMIPPNLDAFSVTPTTAIPNGSAVLATTFTGKISIWSKAALQYLHDYRHQHPYGHCPLPELYRATAEPHGLTIGQFHDMLREMVRQKQVRLHPFTGAAYQLRDEQNGLLAGQEIKYYAEPLYDAHSTRPRGMATTT